MSLLENVFKRIGLGKTSHPMFFSQVEEKRTEGQLVFQGTVIATHGEIPKPLMDNLISFTSELTLVTTTCGDGSGFDKDPRTVDGRKPSRIYRDRFNGVHAAEHLAVVLGKVEHEDPARGHTRGNIDYPYVFEMRLEFENGDQIPDGEITRKAQSALRIANNILRIDE